MKMQAWNRIGVRYLPIRESQSNDLPIRRLLRLSMFQVSVGMTLALVIGTLNRVMIVELGVPAWLVAVMVAVPLLLSPFRAIIGFRSDTHTSLLGWRRVPYLWIGTMLQFGGLAIMPFALLLLNGDSHGPRIAGPVAAGFAFLLVGVGLHTVQTVGLALATDIVPQRSRPPVVTLLCVMMLVGILASSLIFGLLLAHFSEERLIQVVQGAATVAMALNIVALWKQEPRSASTVIPATHAPRFREAWSIASREPDARRRLVAVWFGTFAFGLQDVLLEPYGGQVLHLPVSATTSLTALLAFGGIVGFVLAAILLAPGRDRYRIAAIGTLEGAFAFALVITSAPAQSALLFASGIFGIGLGAAMFLVGTLAGAMDASRGGRNGLALGTWGAVQAFAAGGAIAAGGVLRDTISWIANDGHFGVVLQGPAVGYQAVYLLEIALLFATLVALGPLVRFNNSVASYSSKKEIRPC
ncbi:BCD family MFS transporter [Lichenicoccus sp.]|uniref:BCD family MFS transporter n=1 Tax=Lichenicoccus sp. TaxID=2781899 RepID=UPI003D104777